MDKVAISRTNTASATPEAGKSHKPVHLPAGSLQETVETPDGRAASDPLERYFVNTEQLWTTLEQEFRQSDYEFGVSAAALLAQIPEAYRVSAKNFELTSTPEFEYLSRKLGASHDLVETEAELTRSLERYIRFSNRCFEMQVAAEDPSAPTLRRCTSLGAVAETESSLRDLVSELSSEWPRQLKTLSGALSALNLSRQRLERERQRLESLIAVLEQLKSVRDISRAAELYEEHQDLLKAAYTYQRLDACAHEVFRKWDAVPHASDVRSAGPAERSASADRQFDIADVRLVEDFSRHRRALRRRLGTALEHQIVAQFQITLSFVWSAAAEPAPPIPTSTSTSTRTPERLTSEQIPGSSLALLCTLREEITPFVAALYQIGMASGALYRVTTGLLHELNNIVSAEQDAWACDSAQAFTTFLSKCRTFVPGAVAVIDTFFEVASQLESLEASGHVPHRSHVERADVLSAFRDGFGARFRDAVDSVVQACRPADFEQVRFLLKIHVETRDFLKFLDRILEVRNDRPAASSSVLLVDLRDRIRNTMQAAFEKKLESMQVSLNAERWVPATSTAALQSLLDRLVRDTSAPLYAESMTMEDGKVREHSEGQPATVVLMGERFVLVDASQDLFELLDACALCFRDALHCEEVALAHALSMRVLEALRTFNQRSLQLVLGAGAMKTAHLKAITAKHLAVCARTVDLLLRLLHPQESDRYQGLQRWFCPALRQADVGMDPDAKPALERNSPRAEDAARQHAIELSDATAGKLHVVPGVPQEPSSSPQTEGGAATVHAVPELATPREPSAQSVVRDADLERAFERTIADLQVHRAQLLNKIVIIMQTRLRNRIAELRRLPLEQYAVVSETGCAAPSTWASALIRDITTLERILSSVLPTVALRSLFEQIIAAYSQNLQAEFARLTEEYLGGNRGPSTNVEAGAVPPPGTMLNQVAADATALAEAVRNLVSSLNANISESYVADFDAMAHTYHNLAEKHASASSPVDLAEAPCAATTGGSACENEVTPSTNPIEGDAR